MRKTFLITIFLVFSILSTIEARSEPFLVDNNGEIIDNSQSLTLDSHSEKCFQKEFRFQGGLIQIIFDYRIISSTPVKDSFTYIILNSQPIYRVQACDDGNQVKISGNVNQGTYALGFCAQSSPTEAPHQISIKNLVINQKEQCTPEWGLNLIVNGDFEQNPCAPNKLWCTYNQRNYKNQIPGWLPKPQIQVVSSTHLNKPAWAKVGQSRVIELDATGNTCIQQRVGGLKIGRYLLKLDWAAKLGFPLNTSGFDVKVAGKVSRSFPAKNYDINQETIEFTLDQDPSDPLLEFCGTGKSDNVGASIDNVQLLRLNEC